LIDINNSNWPMTNDHKVIVSDIDKAMKVLGTFDGAVDSTNYSFKSIPRREYKVMVGVHFTRSFGGNHLAIALSDSDFVILERSWVFRIEGVGGVRRQIEVHDTRGTILLDEPQIHGKSKVKTDVEIHKGNIYYRTQSLSKGCPTISAEQFPTFMRILFDNINEGILSAVFKVIINPLPPESENYSDFYKVRGALEKCRRSSYEEGLKRVSDKR